MLLMIYGIKTTDLQIRRICYCASYIWLAWLKTKAHCKKDKDETLQETCLDVWYKVPESWIFYFLQHKFPESIVTAVICEITFSLYASIHFVKHSQAATLIDTTGFV